MRAEEVRRAAARRARATYLVLAPVAVLSVDACDGAPPSLEGGLDPTFPAALEARFEAGSGVGGRLAGDGAGGYAAEVNEPGNFRTQIGTETGFFPANRGRCLDVHVVDQDNADLFGPACVVVQNMATKAVDPTDVTLDGLPVGASGRARSSLVIGSGSTPAWLFLGRDEDDCRPDTPAPSREDHKVVVTRTDPGRWRIEGERGIYCAAEGGTPRPAGAAFRITAVVSPGN